jgi:two-component SAPR family response regulator/tetratricopeptide (TPR) repeat protein
MAQRFEILASKISVPLLSGIIARKRLNPVLKKMSNYKLTLVTAGAGYGKSTFVTQACLMANQTIWYRIEENDNDFATFVNYIIAGFKKYDCDFGEKTFDALHQTPLPEAGRRRALSCLVNEMVTARLGSSLLVLDDFHHADSSTDIKNAVAFLINHGPPELHIVLASRTLPDLPLSKYRARGEVLHVKQEDLSFTTAEISNLFFQLFGFKISREKLDTLQKKTGGWISGLMLFYHSSINRNAREIESALNDLSRNQMIFYEYMSENVYLLQSDEIKEFLLKTSLLSRLDVELCDIYLGIENSAAILDLLNKKHLFTSSLTDDRSCYAYHDLFRGFLKSKLRQNHGSDAITKLHNQIAACYRQTEKDEDALNHYLHAGNYGEAITVLSTVGRGMCLEAQFSRLVSLLNQFPEHLRERDPLLLSLQSNICTTTGKLNKAVRLGKKAYTFFRKTEMTESAFIALNDLARSYYLQGNFSSAESALYELLNHSVIPEKLQIEAHGHLIFISAYLGKMDIADMHYSEAKKLLDAWIETRKNKEWEAWIDLNKGFRYYFSGENQKAVEIAELARMNLDSYSSTQVLAFYYHLVSSAYYLTGETQLGMERVKQGLQLVCDNGFQDTQKAWLLISSALHNLSLKRIEESILDMENAYQIFQQGGGKWGEAVCWIVFTAIYLGEEMKEKAEEAIHIGMELVNKHRFPMEEGKLLYFTAMALIEMGAYDNAAALLDRAEELLSHSIFESCFIKYIYAYLYLKTGKPEKSLAMTRTALKMSRNNGSENWFSSKLKWVPDLLAALSPPGKIDKQIGPVPAVCSHTPEPLSVCCLGRLRIFVGENEITKKQWKSKKALEIFKYLILSRSRGYTPKEVLMELLWPEESPEKTGKRLHVALPAFRKTLEPHLKRGSSYLLREKNAYKIDITQNGFVDIDQFMSDLKSAGSCNDTHTKLGHLHAAVSLYKGKLFEEDPYAEWCFDEKERLERAFLTAISKIIEIHEKQLNFEKCILYSEKYLESDPFSEEVYRKLMSFYSKTGNNPMVIKTYDRCRHHIVSNLNCPLNKNTVELYHRIVSFS